MSRLYSDLKFLDYPKQIEAWRNHSVTAPVHVRIKPMNHCNHSCWYCAYRYDDVSLGEDIDLEDQIPKEKMDEIIEDIIDMGVKAVTFSGGGEPTIYKPLPECVEKLTAGGVHVATPDQRFEPSGTGCRGFCRPRHLGARVHGRMEQ